MPIAAPIERPGVKRREPLICGALAGAQCLLLAYLLHLSVHASAGVALLAGLPLAFLCHELLARRGDRRSVQLTVVMFAAGGFGLMLGCIADFGSLGLYGMLGMCRSWSAGGIWPTPEQLWAKVNVMPWASLGMMVGGNVGVALGVVHPRARPVGGAFETYVLCNLGMLVGMVTAEQLATRLALDFDPTAAGVAMVAAMLLGMILGMNALLAAARALRFLSASPAR